MSSSVCYSSSTQLALQDASTAISVSCLKSFHCGIATEMTEVRDWKVKAGIALEKEVPGIIENIFPQ
ncbi:MAG: hypothetical protein OXU61_08790 [Gammaproteobacteria bacterium]|nr:hypothetical protein [Gammaproteobacteria bacterium]